MKAITLVRSFTLVLIFLTGVAQAETKEQCIATFKNKVANQDAATARCTPTPTTTTLPICKSEQLKAMAEEECVDFESARDIKASCDSKFDSYLSKVESTIRACGKAKGGSLETCQARAEACGIASSEVDSGAGASDWMSIMSSIMGSGGSSSSGSGSSGSCNLYDPTFESRKAEFDEKIARLEDEKVEAVTKQADLDDELNQKKQEVNEKISDLEAEFRKDEKEAKSQSMDEAAELQKKILASNKKIRDNLAKVADKNTEIANLSFGIQQIMIESSTLAMNKNCLDKVNAAKAAVLAPVVGADGKKRAPKYTMKESSKIKADLKLIESQCLQSEALKRDAQLKGIFDKKRLLLVEVDTYMKSNEDEQKSIELDRKSLEEKEKLLTENQKKALEEKNIKLDNLSKSVADMAAIVERKKKALDDKIRKRDEQIAELVRQKNAVQPIFEDVQEALGVSSSSKSAYIAACCPTVTSHTGCSQVLGRGAVDPLGGFGTPGSNR